jgi:hypothetical protein
MLLVKPAALLHLSSHLLLTRLKVRVTAYIIGPHARATRVSFQDIMKDQTTDMPNIQTTVNTSPAKRPTRFRISSAFRSRHSFIRLGELLSLSNQDFGCARIRLNASSRRELIQDCALCSRA